MRERVREHSREDRIERDRDSRCINPNPALPTVRPPSWSCGTDAIVDDQKVAQSLYRMQRGSSSGSELDVVAKGSMDARIGKEE